MRRIFIALMLTVATALAGCAPGGPPQTTAVRSAADARTGAQAHRQILAQYGGAYDGAVSGYVTRLGRRLAAQSEQPDAPWTFTVLDSPVVNAFAIPGGYVYVTRGLLALADDEAELAGVIGHEIGHVTADHSAERRTQASAAQLGVLAAVIGAAALGVEGAALDAIGQAGSALGQGAVASYSRGQELEADRLGVRYLARAGYDPTAQADFLESLAAQSALQARIAGARYDPNRVDFFATHPATASRVREAAQAAIAEGAPAGADAPRNRDAFLAAIEGMTYGDSAAQGFVRGRRFIHPELRLAFEAPEGWRITNAAQAVRMAGPNGTVVFDGGRDPGGALETIIGDWAGALARQTRTGRLQDLTRFEIDGLQAAGAWLPVATNGGTAAARLTVIRAPDGRLWRFFGLADPNDARAMAAVEAAPRSFRRLSASEAARARPYRISVVTARAGDSVASLAARMPFEDAREERFRVLNSLGPNEGLTPGRKVKLVVE
jgi:predicted Zn-dependent protease